MALPTLTTIIEDQKVYLKGLSKAAHRGTQFVFIGKRMIETKLRDIDRNPELDVFLNETLDLMKIMVSIIYVTKYILQANYSQEELYCLDRIDPLSPEDTFDALLSFDPRAAKKMLLVCGMDSFELLSCLNNNDKNKFIELLGKNCSSIILSKACRAQYEEGLILQYASIEELSDYDGFSKLKMLRNRLSSYYIQMKDDPMSEFFQGINAFQQRLDTMKRVGNPQSAELPECLSELRNIMHQYLSYFDLYKGIIEEINPLPDEMNIIRPILEEFQSFQEKYNSPKTSDSESNNTQRITEDKCLYKAPFTQWDDAEIGKNPDEYLGLSDQIKNSGPLQLVLMLNEMARNGFIENTESTIHALFFRLSGYDRPTDIEMIHFIGDTPEDNQVPIAAKNILYLIKKATASRKKATSEIKTGKKNSYSSRYQQGLAFCSWDGRTKNDYPSSNADHADKEFKRLVDQYC